MLMINNMFEFQCPNCKTTTILGPYDMYPNRIKSGSCSFEFTKTYDAGNAAFKRAMEKHTSGLSGLYAKPFMGFRFWALSSMQFGCT